MVLVRKRRGNEIRINKKLIWMTLIQWFHFYLENNEDYYSFYGNYKNDERDGKWIGEIVTPNEKKRVQEFYYVNGKKEGLNKETSENKILFQNYKDDNLEGVSLIYLNLKHIQTLWLKIDY